MTDLASLKQTGGLNNDWDLTALALHLLFAPVKANAVPSSAPDGSSYEETIRRCDVSDLALFLNISARPLTELLEQHGRRNESSVARCYRDDVGAGNVIKQIFQEIYLGPSLFRKHYGQEPRFWTKEGLIHRETLLIDSPLLAALSRDHLLAIATGRPKVEADFPLDRFDLRKYFQTVITLDDSIMEEERIFYESGTRVSLMKPDPYMLDRIASLIGKLFNDCYYLGDMPDDMQAARASKTGYKGVGVTVSSTEPEALRRDLLRAGADHIITDYSTLPGIFV
ncbi:MAG: HAD hydrolase-like protein [Deltaproteobacteria bacterium]|nr:HAD hydrolase-like protein [Deltaproteobacteria bacterium]